jgi:crossover junction endodeoxyribonuclease RuvC
MGIDPSLTGTGIAFLYAGRLKTFRLVPPAKMKGVERLDWLSREMDNTLVSYDPDCVAIEAYSFGSRNSHAHALGDAGGAFRLALYRRAVPTIEVPPTSLKKFATGSGNAEKATVAKELYKRFGVDLANNDEVDAAGLALACMVHEQPDGFSLTAAQREAVKKFQPIFLQRVANTC